MKKCEYIFDGPLADKDEVNMMQYLMLGGDEMVAMDGDLWLKIRTH